MIQWMQSEFYAGYYNQISIKPVSSLDTGRIKTEIMC